jgi:hypothetical protein
MTMHAGATDALVPVVERTRARGRSIVLCGVLAVLVLAVFAVNVLAAHDLIAHRDEARANRRIEQRQQGRLEAREATLGKLRAQVAAAARELERRTTDRNATARETALIDKTVKNVRAQLSSTNGTLDQQRALVFVLGSCIQSMIDASNELSVGYTSAQLAPMQGAALVCAGAKL